MDFFLLLGNLLGTFWGLLLPISVCFIIGAIICTRPESQCLPYTGLVLFCFILYPNPLHYTPFTGVFVQCTPLLKLCKWQSQCLPLIYFKLKYFPPKSLSLPLLVIFNMAITFRYISANSSVLTMKASRLFLTNVL